MTTDILDTVLSLTALMEEESDRLSMPGFHPDLAECSAAKVALVGLLAEIARSDTTQAVVATHSPVVAATPGARILEVTADGLTERRWRDLDLVQHWTAFLADPDSYLRYLDAPDDDADDIG